MASKTIRRDTLMKMIDAGKVEAKCNISLTDDYAFDNAYGFGKTDWMKARISRPTFRTITLQNGIERDVLDNSDFIEGMMNFKTHDFNGNCGKAYQQDDGTIFFYIHSNLNYTLRIAA